MKLDLAAGVDVEIKLAYRAGALRQLPEPTLGYRRDFPGPRPRRFPRGALAQAGHASVRGLQAPGMVRVPLFRSH
jgi:hypothetical protein